MKTPRLVAAIAALVLLAAAGSAATIAVERLERRRVHLIAPQMFAHKMRGSALQRAAFREPDLLPIYGSSDLNVANRYHGSAVFRDYPTGFTLFPVGDLGSTSLIWLQALAAVGEEVRGRKVAVSIPTRAFLSEDLDAHAYAANFSRLQANELVFNTRLSFPLRQAAARRLLGYPETLSADPLLRFALRRLAGTSAVDRALYVAMIPLGKLHTAVLRLQDHWETLRFLRAQLGWGTATRHRSDLDWAALADGARGDAQQRADRGRFGFENAFSAAHAPEIARQRGIYASPAALPEIRHTAEWGDLDLLLRAVRELGGEPLLLGIPMNGEYADYLGIAAESRRALYDQLRALAAERGAVLIDFAEHEGERYFSADATPHLSGVGWMHFNRALDAFFHDRDPHRS